MFHFNIIFRARFRLDIFFQKTVELSVSHSFHLFNLILRYNIKVQGSNLKMYSGVTLGLQKIIYILARSMLSMSATHLGHV